MAFYFGSISNLAEALGKIKLYENIVSYACIYVGKTSQKIVAGEEDFVEKLGGARMKNVPAVVCKFLQVNFCLENCVS